MKTNVTGAPESKFITVDRLKSLQESIGFLDTYKKSSNETHWIKNEDESEDVERTILLSELGDLNSRRDELIKLLTTK